MTHIKLTPNNTWTEFFEHYYTHPYICRKPMTVFDWVVPHTTTSTSAVPRKTESGWEYEFQVPGFNKTNLKVSVVDGRLLKVVGDNGKQKFEDTTTLLSNLEPSTIKAKCVDGILTVSFEQQKKKIDEVTIE